MFEAFSDMDGINEMGINQGQSALCGGMFDQFNHGKCWSKASGPISSVSSWIELSDQSWTINCSAFVLDARDWKKNVFFKGRDCALTSHDRSQTNFFLICCPHERGQRDCWIDVTSLYTGCSIFTHYRGRYREWIFANDFGKLQTTRERAWNAKNEIILTRLEKAFNFN